jgi:hypothetical protein
MNDHIIDQFDISCFLDKFLLSIKNIRNEYFQVPTSYDPDGISRERVFCYELYHQFRIILGDEYPFTLHGELDKSGHINFHHELQSVPDFLVHKPGTHDGNMVIIEVKGRFDRRNILLDLLKINKFISDPNIHYHHGIFLLYNYSLDYLINHISFQHIRNIPPDTDQKIYLIGAIDNQRLECSSLSLIRKELS